MVMLRKLSELLNGTVLVAGTPVGVIRDFLIDVGCWRIRYLVLAGARGLADDGANGIAVPIAAATPVPGGERTALALSLQTSELEHCPTIAVAGTLGREDEIALHQALHWRPYWECEAKSGFRRAPLISALAIRGRTVKAAGRSLMLDDAAIELDTWEVTRLMADEPEAKPIDPHSLAWNSEGVLSRDNHDAPAAAASQHPGHPA